MKNTFSQRSIVLTAILFFSLVSSSVSNTMVQQSGPITKALRRVGSYLKTKEGKGVLLFSAMYVRLKTKGGKWDYKMEDWKKDLAELCTCWNLFDADTYKTVTYLFDKWIVGRAFGIVEISYNEVNKDGRTQKVKDVRVDAKPFGLLGYFDAYVIQQFKKFAENLDNVDKIQKGFRQFSELKEVF